MYMEERQYTDTHGLKLPPKTLLKQVSSRREEERQCVLTQLCVADGEFIHRAPASRRPYG